jgi:hypothetical protein
MVFAFDKNIDGSAPSKATAFETAKSVLAKAGAT